jgi:hypothetical protein
MPVSQHSVAVLPMAIDRPGNLALTDPVAFVDILASVLITHEYSLCPTS